MAFFTDSSAGTCSSAALSALTKRVARNEFFLGFACFLLFLFLLFAFWIIFQEAMHQDQRHRRQGKVNEMRQAMHNHLVEALFETILPELTSHIDQIEKDVKRLDRYG